MQDALKPCPFCGAQPWGIFGPHTDLGQWWVECHGVDRNANCGDWYCSVDSDDPVLARAEVTKAWNRRAPPLPAQVAPGAINNTGRCSMTPSPTPSLDGEAGEASLTDLVHKLHYAAYSWGFEAGKFGQHVDTTTAGNKANAALNSLLSALAAAIPALPPELATCTNSQTALIRDLIGALQEVLPYLDDRRSQQERELGADVRNLIRQAQRESQPAPTPDAAPLSIEDAVALVRAKANAGYGYGPKGSRDEFDRCYSLSPLQLATVINAARAASMQASTTDAAQKPEQPQ